MGKLERLTFCAVCDILRAQQRGGDSPDGHPGYRKAARPVKVNRPAVVLLAVAGTVVGMVPTALWLRRPWVLLLFAAEAASVTFFFALKLESPVTETPTVAALLLRLRDELGNRKRVDVDGT
jgi:hypothetical protein